jgi:quinoprotein glucose dehydrogenase
MKLDTLRIVARGPRIQTWVNGNLVEDLVNDDAYMTHPRVHRTPDSRAQCARGESASESGVTTRQPLTIRWRHIRIRPLPKP